jgi:gamma-glutamyltranspeptidase/glutathione hydrolase
MRAMKHELSLFLMLVLACDARTSGPAPATAPAKHDPIEKVESDVNRMDANHELGGGDRPIGRNYARSPVYAQHGMVATAHPLASQIALDILRDGGTAVDAAIAANAALGLMEPIGNGIGGDLFAIVWDPKTATLHGFNGSGRAPVGRSLADLRAKIGDVKQGIPAYGSLPVTVPGTVDGWFEMHARFGRLEPGKLLAPTIAYAREGFPVSPVIAMYWQKNMENFERVGAQIEELDNARATYLIDGKAPVAGQLFRNPDLADTLELLATEGRAAFYTGSIARTIDTYMQRIGGDLRYADFAAHHGEWVTPGHVEYRGYDVYELPPNGQGYAALQMLAILENVEVAKLERGGPELLHYIIEAKRLAFEDVARYYADPTFAAAPLDALLSDAYARERFAKIDPARASAAFGPGEPKLEGPGDTTYLTVADADGMMVSLIQSNYRGMGSGLVPDGLGFMLHDRGQLFALDEGHANVYAPGKRPFHTIIPAFVCKDGKPWLSFGVMGGSMQPQGHVQVLINLIDFGMNLQEAGDAARVRHEGGRQPTAIDEDPLGTVYVESGVSADAIAGLRARGHVVEIGGGNFGGYQAILRDAEHGVYVGATEMRKDGLAIGY